MTTITAKVIKASVSPQGKKLDAKGMQAAYAFTQTVYGLYKKDDLLTLREEAAAADVAALLAGG